MILLHPHFAGQAHLLHELHNELVVVVKTTVLQFKRYSSVTISSSVLSNYGTNCFFQLRIFVWLLLLPGVVIVCAARETGDVQQQRQFVFMP